MIRASNSRFSGLQTRLSPLQIDLSDGQLTGSLEAKQATISKGALGLQWSETERHAACSISGGQGITQEAVSADGDPPGSDASRGIQDDGPSELPRSSHNRIWSFIRLP